jgi:GPH family glycoside/pentoside/hexuronide:cation symporter
VGDPAALKIGRGVKLAYGLGSATQGVGNVALSTTTVTFYLVSVVGLRPALVGAVVLGSLVVDAVVDPAIGRASDMLRSRWGRRHPFMFASIVPIALAMCLLWVRPAGLSSGAMAAYALTMLVALRVAISLYQIPSDALAPELAPDYHERTNLLSYRWFFGLAGFAAMGIVLGAVFLRLDKSHPLGPYDPQAYLWFGGLSAVVATAAILVSALATQRYIPQLALPPQRRHSLGESLREMAVIVGNPSLLVVMACGVIGGVAAGITQALTAFMNYYFWALTPQAAALIGLLASPAALLGVVIAPALSRALDKKRTMIVVFALSVFTGVIPVALRLLGLAPPNGSPLVVVMLTADLIVAGTLALIGFVIFGSMVADVVEDSAVKTGVRSEGLLFAANGLVPKVTTGLGALIAGVMLEIVHFHEQIGPGGVRSVAPGVMHDLALISMPAGAVLNSIAVAVLLLYRIDRGAHEANLEALRLAASVASPPTLLPTGGPIIEP